MEFTLFPNSSRRLFNLQIMKPRKSVRQEDSTYIRYFDRDRKNQPVIVKSIDHFRPQNERDILKRFQFYTPFIRPLIDEIVELSNPPVIVLKYLDNYLLNTFVSRRLTNLEINILRLARRILEALRVIYKDNFVHTGKKTYCLH